MGEEINTEIEKVLKVAGVNEAKSSEKIFVTNHNDDNQSGTKTEVKVTKIVTITNKDIKKPSEGQVKKISKVADESDGKLSIEKLNIYIQILVQE